MKILAIPGKNNKNYSLDIFELFKNYKNEVVNLFETDQVTDISCFTIFKKLTGAFIFENELINKKIDKVLNSSKFDFLWNLGLNQKYLPHIAQIAKQKNFRLIQTISDDSIIQFQRNIISQAIFPDLQFYSINKMIKTYSSGIDLFISQSRFLKDLLIKEGVCENKIINIPIFIDTKKYIPYYKSEDYFVYEHISNNEADLKFLLKTMEEVPQHKLIVISDKNSDKKVKTMIENYNLHNVLWIENLDLLQKQNIIKLSRFSIILSDIKPEKILENYAWGKPVLALDSGINTEYVVNTYSGLLFKNNQEDVINKINYLMINKNFCKDAGNFARNLAENCFDKQTYYRQIFNAFNAVGQKTPLKLNKIDFLNIS